jgi:hypothetical protein
MRHVIGQHAWKPHAGRITTCCRFGIRADQLPLAATCDCPWCFAYLELGEKIWQLFGEDQVKIHLREVADRLRIPQYEIAIAVAGSPYLDWASPYSPDQIVLCRWALPAVPEPKQEEDNDVEDEGRAGPAAA